MDRVARATRVAGVRRMPVLAAQLTMAPVVDVMPIQVARVAMAPVVTEVNVQSCASDERVFP